MHYFISHRPVMYVPVHRNVMYVHIKNQLKKVLSNIFLGVSCKSLSTRFVMGGITGQQTSSSLIRYQIPGCSSSGFLSIRKTNLGSPDYYRVLRSSNKQSHYMVCQLNRYKD